MKVAGYTLQIPNTASLLLVVAFLMVIIFITVWMRYAGRDVVRMWKEAHSDPTGHIDLKYILATFLTVFATGLMIVRGCLYNMWPPEYFTVTYFLFKASLLGLGSADLWQALKTGNAPKKENYEQENNP